MPASIEVNTKNICRFIWVLLSLGTLQFGLGICIAGLGTLGEETVFLLMLCLSFPSGAIMSVFMDPPGIEGPLELSIMWLTGFVAGYLQWFVVLPAMCGRSIITLGLSTPHVASTARKKSKHHASPKSKTKRQRVIPAFDRFGRTPVQRAIKSHGWR